ncbi:O-succinylbenzoate synthase [Vibrio sp. qd031]|uniref:o-succinylbenzoate synthase n=1 Tax=Vibrio sp. qd031 TaxID=1603038 RepID=UPI000A0FBC20|nr:o-succinylbenzoate synthase [Vibrio sp. qd031]ORT50282.1 O-succinylbenzoate synthase [Vibrio sp. qd031]
MRKAQLYRYRLPMDSGVVLRDKKITEREGWVVELIENDRRALSEISPLPGWSEETIDQAYLEARRYLHAWIDTGRFELHMASPSVAFGLSMAELELHGELPQEGNFISAPLCTGDPDELLPRLAKLQGEKVAKIKVGLYEPVRDGMLVNLFLESIPDLKLRLDANRTWTTEQADKFAQYVKPAYRQRISFIEEPCAKPGQSLTFGINNGIAIGWDETLQEAVREPNFDLSQLTGAKAIVIKPSLIGSVTKCQYIVEQAKALNLKAVISSTLETSIGLTQLARFARWLTPLDVPGLDTLDLFQQQLHTPWPGSDLPIATLDSQELVLSL